MPATTSTAALPWQDLPPDVVREISCRLHTTVDLVRFHAVCKPWRSTFDDDGGSRVLLPSLLAPAVDAGGGAADQLCRCVFSGSSYRAPGICVHDRRVACADGTAAWLVCGQQQDWLVNPLTAARLPGVSLGDSRRANGRWLDHRVHTHRVVSGDGTILLYGFEHGFTGLALKPGHKEWRRVQVHGVRRDRCCALVADNGAVYAMDQDYCYVVSPSLHHITRVSDRSTKKRLPDEPGKVRRCSYLLEFLGEVLLVSVLHDTRSRDLSVSFYSMNLEAAESHDDDDEEEEDAPEAWVRRDDAVSLLCDHVLFLGFPSSFAVEASRFGGELSGGSAYFVVLQSMDRQCVVYRHDFRLGKTTAVETLPPEWVDDRCMWFLPQPDIAPIAARETAALQPRAPAASSGTHWRIYVGDLSPIVDNSRLREMFSEYGKVASAKVAYDKRGRSRGFGFVNMATQDGYDKALAVVNGAPCWDQKQTIAVNTDVAYHGATLLLIEILKFGKVCIELVAPSDRNSGKKKLSPATEHMLSSSLPLLPAAAGAHHHALCH